MFVALDAEGNRLYATSTEKSVKCFCPVCNEELRLRKGSKNKPHFAHRQDTDCLHGKNPDYKSEWHIRMQEYFPREACEVRFVDKETGEILDYEENRILLVLDGMNGDFIGRG